MMKFNSLSKARAAGAALLGLLATVAVAPAQAADLGGSIKDDPVYVDAPRLFNWTGFYVGLNAGGHWSHDDGVRLRGTDTGNGGLGAELADGTVPSAFGLDNQGFIGGAQAGYNWQRGNIVFGIETDIQAVDGGDKATVTSTNPARVPITTTVSRDLEWLGTLRARIGVTVTPNLLAYATGGLAYGETSVQVASVCPACVPARNVSATKSGVDAGWTVGGGLEYAMSRNWSLKGEYLYYDLGSKSATINYNYGANTSSMTATTETTGSIARVGLNYKF